MMQRFHVGTLALVAVALACSPRAPLSTAEATPWRQPGDVIDSVLPMPVLEARFREGLTRVDTLAGGAASIDALASRYLDAIRRHDTTGLRSLLVTRAEFAWIVFPEHLYRAEPYALDPAILWLQVQAANGKAIGRLLDRSTGEATLDGRVRCERTPREAPGAVTFHGPCRAVLSTAAARGEGRLFGSVVEHRGRFKLLGAANDL